MMGPKMWQGKRIFDAALLAWDVLWAILDFRSGNTGDAVLMMILTVIMSTLIVLDTKMIHKEKAIRAAANKPHVDWHRVYQLEMRLFNRSYHHDGSPYRVTDNQDGE